MKKLPSPTWPARSSVPIANTHGSVAKVIERICGKLGYTQIQTLKSAEEIIKTLSSSRFNLILLDDNISVYDIFKTIALMKGAPGASNAQIILTTTKLTSATASQAIAAGADDILLKPFSAKMMMLKVSAAGQPRRPTSSSSDLAWI